MSFSNYPLKKFIHFCHSLSCHYYFYASPFR